MLRPRGWNPRGPLIVGDEEAVALLEPRDAALELAHAGQVLVQLAAVRRAEAPVQAPGVVVIRLEIVPELNFLLPLILVFGKLAPMVGLLGTVTGMIQAFDKIAGATKVEPSALSGDIGMALFTTAEGLILAIPLIFAHAMFSERVKGYRNDLERAAHTALNMLPQMQQGPPVARPPQP